MPARSQRSRVAALGLAALAVSCSTAVAGPLAARVDERGTVRFLQRDGPALFQAPGSLRFRVNGRWRPARPAEVRLRRVSPGVVELRARRRGPGRVSAVAIGFRGAAGERYFGFGERSDAVAQSGTVVESYVSDGPWSEATRDVAKAIVPPAGFRPRDDATYYPIPWLLSSRGYGVLVANDETSTFRLPAGTGRWVVRVAAAQLRLLVFAGPTPARALSRFTALTGRQPARGSMGVRPVAADGTAERASDGRPDRRPAEAARRRRPRLGRGDAAALPALRPRSRPRELRVGAGRVLPPRGSGRAHLRQPDALRLV